MVKYELKEINKTESIIKDGHTMFLFDAVQDLIRKDYLERLYDLEHYRVSKLLAFIESLESVTNDWDALCDCDPVEGIHKKDCMTVKARLDYENVLKVFNKGVE